jgi:hypothetical protein
LAIGVERSQSAPVKILQIGVGAGERQIDIVEHAGIERAGLSGCPGHQPFGEGSNRRGIFVVEERAMAGARRMRVRCGSCLLQLRRGLRQGLWCETRPRGRAGTGHRADQERAARFVVLAHACLLPNVTTGISATIRVARKVTPI